MCHTTGLIRLARLLFGAVPQACLFSRCARSPVPGCAGTRTGGLCHGRLWWEPGQAIGQ